MSSKPILPCLIVLACLSLATPAARAVDGVLEIHQACVATGCFPGDSAGFPVEITVSGSYVLTSNLVVASDPGLDAIRISVDGVNLDLNGHHLIGPSACTSTGCEPSTGSNATDGSGVLVVAPGPGSPSPRGTSVHNGTVRGFAGNGISAGPSSQVIDVYALGNDNGISGGGSSVISGNRVEGNARLGIFSGGLVSGNTVNDNGGFGILTSGSALVETNVVTDNDDEGIFAQSTADTTGYRNNVLAGNNGGGPQVGANSTTKIVELGPNICGTDTNCP